ncbi:MAG TPA: hypothetical protein VM490_05915 [Armatimonadaceae bacterium]|nr:hypothetical protein [Armatimonadaceae bacterium]
MIITITVPDDLAARIQALPEASRDMNQFAVSALAARVEALEVGQDAVPLRPYAEYESREAYIASALAGAPGSGVEQETAAGIAAGIADEVGGDLLTLQEAQSHFEAEYEKARTELRRVSRGAH